MCTQRRVSRRFNDCGLGGDGSVKEDELCSPSPTVRWMTLSSTFSPSVPNTPMAGEKPSWKAQPWM